LSLASFVMRHTYYRPPKGHYFKNAKKKGFDGIWLFGSDRFKMGFSIGGGPQTKNAMPKGFLKIGFAKRDGPLIGACMKTWGGGVYAVTHIPQYPVGPPHTHCPTYQWCAVPIATYQCGLPYPPPPPRNNTGIVTTQRADHTRRKRLRRSWGPPARGFGVGGMAESVSATKRPTATSRRSGISPTPSLDPANPTSHARRACWRVTYVLRPRCLLGCFRSECATRPRPQT
jgi:hypothetical protein